MTPVLRPSFDDALVVQHDAETLADLFPALMMQATRTAQTVATGFHGRKRAGPGESFWQHRPYTQTDPAQAIDWRQSARSGDRLYVRQNEWETAASVWIWRDPSPSLDYAWAGHARAKSPKAPPLPTKRRRADILAAAVTMLLSDAGERIGLISGPFTQTWPTMRGPFQGRKAPARILEILLKEESSQLTEKSDFAPPPPGAKALFFSDFFTEIERIENAAHRLGAQGVSGALVQVIDPSEEIFPFSGRTEFRDIVSKERLTVADASGLAKPYRARFLAHRERLEQTARRLGWAFIPHRTDNPAETALLALYAALSDPKATQW